MTIPLPGTRVASLETPVLVVDMDALEHNIRTAAARFEGSGVRLRPHVKNHKAAAIAHLQLAAGTVGGVCAAKVSEAEAMVDAGVRQVLVANQVVTPAKIWRLAALALRADVLVAVDDAEHVRRIAEGAQAIGATIGAVIEVNTSMRRAGIRHVEQAPALAHTIAGTPGLRFRGIMSHQTIDGFPDRETRYLKAREYFGRVLAVKRAIEDAGLPVEIVSTGETWSYDVAADTPGITEVECGTYVFMEVPYTFMREFRIAARVLGSVISTPSASIAIGDVPMDAIGAPNGVPTVEDIQGVRVRAVTLEHTVLESDGPMPLCAGDRFALLTHQQDVTMNRWDRYVVARAGTVVDVWEVTARGCAN